MIFTSIYRDTNVLYDKALGDVKRSSYFISRYNIIVHKYVVTYSFVRCSLLNSHYKRNVPCVTSPCNSGLAEISTISHMRLRFLSHRLLLDPKLSYPNLSCSIFSYPPILYPIVYSSCFKLVVHDSLECHLLHCIICDFSNLELRMLIICSYLLSTYHWEISFFPKLSFHLH